MSKILKFIVNLFLLAAILIAVAILVPPVAGITTTIVDTPTMNTNLPLGSVTYSTYVDVDEIKAGDEILKENGNTSTYAYIVREADPEAGRFKVVNAMDRGGSEEEIFLRNNVPKVAVVVPLIGYVLIAMHSLEGRVIVGLVVLLIIILFILSELWKEVPDDEFEDEDLPAEAEEPQEHTGVTAREETGIDTEAIRAAVEENQSAAEHASYEEAEGTEAEASEEAGDTEPGTDAGAESAEQEYADEASGAAEPHESDLHELDLAEEEEITGSEETSAEAEPHADEADPAGDAGAAEDAAGAAEKAEDADAEAGPEEREERADEAAPSAEAGPELMDVTNEADYLVSGRFVPVSHPSLDEIMENAKNAGEKPQLKKDEPTGITFVDYSDLL